MELEEEFNYEGKEVKDDEEGFTESFGVPSSPEEIKTAQDFFEEYGFIVFRDVVNENELNELKNDIFTKYCGGYSSEDVRSDKHWTNAPWKSIYSGKYNSDRGFLGYFPANSQTAQDVRSSPNMHQIFSTILRENKLWCTFDRFGFMRPTKNVPFYDKEKDEVILTDKEEWKTMKGFIHWDLNPWVEQDFCRVQGIVAVTDHTKTSGGFHCIPSFHKVLPQWASANKKRRDDREVLVNLESENIEHAVRRITMRKGSVCIWDSRLPHGNWPNDDDQFRMVFYLTYFPALEENKIYMDYRKKLAESFCRSVSISPLGKMITGIEKFDIPPVPFADPSFINRNSRNNLSQWGF